jgi:hypothetical protein
MAPLVTASVIGAEFPERPQPKRRAGLQDVLAGAGIFGTSNPV